MSSTGDAHKSWNIGVSYIGTMLTGVHNIYGAGVAQNIV
mgnify:CR=1 FL=1